MGLMQKTAAVQATSSATHKGGPDNVPGVTPGSPVSLSSSEQQGEESREAKTELAPSEVTFRSVTPVTVVEFDRLKIKQSFETHPEWSQKVAMGSLDDLQKKFRQVLRHSHMISYVSMMELALTGKLHQDELQYLIDYRDMNKITSEEHDLALEKHGITHTEWELFCQECHDVNPRQYMDFFKWKWQRRKEAGAKLNEQVWEF